LDNVEIARALSEVADVLEIQEGNPFRIRAYRNAVRTVEAQTVPLALALLLVFLAERFGPARAEAAGAVGPGLARDR